MMQEGDEEVGVGTVSVSSEPVQDPSASVLDKQCSSLTIDQMVRDFIIAKTVGIKVSSDRAVDSAKVTEHCRKEHHKLNKDKKKKKKKKKHKSHRKDGSSKHGHRRHHHHRDHKSEDATSESDSSDDNKDHNESSAKDIAGERTSVELPDASKKNASLLMPIKQSEECWKRSETSPESHNSGETKEVLSSAAVCSKCSKCLGGAPIITVSEERKLKTDEAQCHCQSLVNNKNEADLPQCKEGDIMAKLITSKSDEDSHFHHTSSKSNASSKQYVTETTEATEAACHLHRDSTLPHKRTTESRQLTKRGISASSKSQQYADANKMPESGNRQHSNAERRHGHDIKDCDKSCSSRRKSPLHSLLTEDGKSDDVVFVKKVSACGVSQSSSFRETFSNMVKSSREQKSSWVSSRSVRKRNGSKCSESSGDDEVTTSRSKSKKNRRQAKDSSPVILLSDDDVDILSDEMVEKLHKRLTTSIKKSKELKELQAEREQTVALVNSETASERTTSHSSELILEDCDSMKMQTDVSDIIMPPSDSANVEDASHGEVSSAGEQSAAKSTTLGLLGKKTLKFGLKISESSAAWISKGIKSNETTGEKVQSCCMLNCFCQYC